jgi:hypothetical protein
VQISPSIHCYLVIEVTVIEIIKISNLQPATMMSNLKALTKDSIGDRKFKLQTDLDDVKFDEDNI